MADTNKTLNSLHKDIEAKISEYNAALKENDSAKMSQIEKDLKDVEQSYDEAKSVEVFERLSKKEKPMLEAIITHSYLVTAHRVIREEGVTKGFEIIEDKVRQIDLVKFSKFCKLPSEWQYMVEKFNQLLALRTANELKMTKAQIQNICDSFYMNKLAKDVEMGKTPDSNTAICKQLQMVVDAILFEDNGNGKNTYRVNNHDVAYLLMCYTRRGRKVLSVAVAKSVYIHRLIADVIHRIATNKAYDLEYRMVAKKDTAPKAETTVKPKVPKVSEVETIEVEKETA